MEKNAFFLSFEKQAMGSLGTASSLAGLGVLAAPSVSSLAGKPWKEKSKDVAEIAGLGMIAAPEAHDLMGMLRKGVKSLPKGARRVHL
jgi:hypothetical protein